MRQRTWLWVAFIVAIAATAALRFVTSLPAAASWAALIVVPPTLLSGLIVLFKAPRAPLSASHAHQDADYLQAIRRRQLDWQGNALAAGRGGRLPLPLYWQVCERSVMNKSVRTDAEIVAASLNAGAGQHTVEFLMALRRRRLVLIGAPGSGKSDILLEMSVALLRSKQIGEQPAIIPFFTDVSGWAAHAVPFATWLEARIAAEIPELAVLDSSDPGKAEEVSTAREFVASGLIVPFLDGFDELTPQLRGAAIERINHWLNEDRGVVMASQIEAFEQAVTGLGAEVLAEAAVIEINAVDGDQAWAYLARSATPSVSACWAPSTALKGDVAFQSGLALLNTPLMVTLGWEAAKTGLFTPSTLGRIAELGPGRLLQYLWNFRVERTCRDFTNEPGWREVQAQSVLRWMKTLAGRNRLQGASFGWWDIPQLLPGWLQAVTLGMLTFVIDTIIIYASTSGVSRGDRLVRK